jgi:hypothetical protein
VKAEVRTAAESCGAITRAGARSSNLGDEIAEMETK